MIHYRTRNCDTPQSFDKTRVHVMAPSQNLSFFSSDGGLSVPFCAIIFIYQGAIQHVGLLHSFEVIIGVIQRVVLILLVFLVMEPLRPVRSPEW